MGRRLAPGGGVFGTASLRSSLGGSGGGAAATGGGGDSRPDSESDPESDV
jgi:hypothetical protein